MDLAIVYQEFSDILIKQKSERRKKIHFFLFKMYLWSFSIVGLLLVSNKIISLVLFFVVLFIIGITAPFIIFSIPFGKPVRLNKRESDLCMVEAKKLQEKYLAIMEEQKNLIEQKEEARKQLKGAKKDLWVTWVKVQNYKGEKADKEIFEKIITSLSGV